MRPLFACLWLALPLCEAGLAVELDGLYRIETPVQSRADSARAADLRAALNQTLKRLVRPADLGSRAVKEMLAKPENYVLEFDYASHDAAGNPATILRVEFDPAQIDGELRKHGIGVLGAERPVTLIWLGMRDSQNQWAAASELAPQTDRILGELSNAIGLPIDLPLWDLPDQQALSWADIENGNAARVRAAAQRYETDTLLTGLLTPAPGGWEARWRFYLGPSEEAWQSKPADLRETLGAGLEGAFARLSARAIPRDTATASLELRITGIESLDDANRAAAVLEKLSPVAKLEWLSVGADQAAFKLKVRGGAEALRQALSFGGKFKPAEDAASEGVLVYRYAR